MTRVFDKFTGKMADTLLEQLIMDTKITPWYDLPSELTDEDKLEVLQILINSHSMGNNSEALAMVKEWERVLSDRIAEQELLGNNVNKP